MEKRSLGKTNLLVAPLTFGGNVFGWTVDEQRSFELLDSFTSAGFNFIDTADVYSRWKPGNKGGESETIIGNWMKQRGKRNEVVIASKVGSDMGQGRKDLRKEYIIKAAEDSLQRLQTDHIDLYQTHWDDETTPLEETLEAYARLINDGKVNWIGASNLSPARLTASLDASRQHNFPFYQSFQPHYNLYEREVFEKELEQICVQNDLGVLNYSSLASGFLTGKYRNENDLAKSARGGGVKKYLDDKGFRILNALDAVALETGTTNATVALAWLMARPGITAPIASATNIEQLDELMKAAELKLDKPAVDSLDAASAWK